MGAALVVDTSGNTGYVAVMPVGETEPAAFAERRLAVRATQEELLPAVEAVLVDAKVRLSELAAIAVVTGPGSFTGVRIGLAAAKGMCEATGVPLVTLSRLAVLARAAIGSPVWSWLQAGRGDVYVSRFASASLRGGNGLAPETAATFPVAEVLSLDQAIAAASGELVVVCEEALRAAAPSTMFIDELDFERSLRDAAGEAVHARRWAEVALSDAMYLRVPDAELAMRASRA